MALLWRRRRADAVVVAALVATTSLQTGCGPDVTVSVLSAELSVTPTLVDLETVAVGTEQYAQVRLDSIGSGDVEVLGVEILNISGDYFFDTSESFTTVVQGTPSYLSLLYFPEDSGYHYAKITIVNDSSESRVEIEARGIAAAGAATLWPHALDFGNIEVGESQTETVTVENDGDLDLEITEVDVDGAGFSVAGDFPMSLGAGDDVDLQVSFSPEELSAAVGSLALSVSGGVSVADVILRGNDCENGDPAMYDVDEDGYASCGGDCDDDDDDTHPGAEEIYDGLDNDCDDVVDEGTVGYDDDGDGATELDGDCNDGDADVSPDADEIADNGVDDDCDGVVDTGSVDPDGDGYTEAGGDCEPSDPKSYPGAPEVADGVDNDCDGIVDEGTSSYDDDGDGYSETGGDCDDSNAAISPDATESANWIDDDCDGTVDEGTVNADDDGDGFSELGGDCDDDDDSISPAAVEVFGDGIDNNCDGVTE
jgi:hypothetical protein